MIIIKFLGDKKSIEIDAETIGEAVKKALSNGADLRWADLRGADLSGVDLSGACLRDANLRHADLSGADLDYSCFPIWCGSLTVKIDKRVFCQLLYHTLRAGQSVDDPEVKKLFAIPEVVALANQFHRVEECGKIKTESEADDE